MTGRESKSFRMENYGLIYNEKKTELGLIHTSHFDGQYCNKNILR